MKISELWLREWVNPPLSSENLASQLTLAGLEVDGLYDVCGNFNQVIVAKVLKTSRHPKADKLNLCEVDTGHGSSLHIVCGASNVRADLMVALALPGATLPNEIHIKETTIRGERSEGMLCSYRELGMDIAADGIIELPKDAPLGMDLRQYLLLDDKILDIDLTPNRGDCLSVYGIAREVAALNQLTVKPLSKSEIEDHIKDKMSVAIKAPESCSTYCGRIIRDINCNAITPLWMKERLRRQGVRPISPVVDVTNYVMLELGQPMHAFDLDKVAGEIQVRFARKGEHLNLLDGQEVHLEEDSLVIADRNKPIALAGIMGSEESAVSDETAHVFLESAHFTPLAIAKTARRFHLTSESAQRFERGVCPSLAQYALARATELLLGIAGGKAGPITEMPNEKQSPAQKQILFNPKRLKQLIGVDISEEKMATLLLGLNMPFEKEGNAWRVTVPSYRFDIALEVDIIEEIIRLYGYDQLGAAPIAAYLHAGSVQANESLAQQMRNFLVHRGYQEIINYSFVDPELQQVLYEDKVGLQLMNPISSELSVMRLGLWPGLLATMIHNLHRQRSALKLVEVGTVFLPKNNGTEECLCLSGLITGEHAPLNWSEPSRGIDFFDLKGDLQALFGFLKVPPVTFLAATHSALHPGQTAKIVCHEQEIGYVGALHPKIAQALDLESDVMLFELYLKPALMASQVHYQPISKYPSIRRDLSLIAADEICAADIENAISSVIPASWLKAIDIFDVYRGTTIAMGKKSLGIALTLQDDHRTLIDEEINAVIDAIIKTLNKQFDIILRE